MMKKIIKNELFKEQTLIPIVITYTIFNTPKSFMNAIKEDDLIMTMMIEGVEIRIKRVKKEESDFNLLCVINMMQLEDFGENTKLSENQTKLEMFLNHFKLKFTEYLISHVDYLLKESCYQEDEQLLKKIKENLEFKPYVSVKLERYQKIINFL